VAPAIDTSIPRQSHADPLRARCMASSASLSKCRVSTGCEPKRFTMNLVVAGVSRRQPRAGITADADHC
jgi:hypothetical protein